MYPSPNTCPPMSTSRHYRGTSRHYRGYLGKGLQGYLAHRKQHSPLGPTNGPYGPQCSNHQRSQVPCIPSQTPAHHPAFPITVGNHTANHKPLFKKSITPFNRVCRISSKGVVLNSHSSALPGAMYPYPKTCPPRGTSLIRTRG